jgi:rhomboid family GlyGly-CTERM serine protease
MRRSMISATSLRQSFSGLGAPLAIALLIAALSLAGPSATEGLAYAREPLAQGQWWRALSGHFVHLGVVHAALNLCGLLLLVLLCPARLRAAEWLRRVLVLALGTSLLLYVAAPAVERYVGLSGVLHGLLLLGLVPMARRGDRVAMAALAILLAKLVLEQVLGASADEERLIGAGVVTMAHLFGTLAALVYGFAFGTFRTGERTQ